MRLKNLLLEADYVHIGYGKYKEKGKEKDPKAQTFKKDDAGKFVPFNSDDTKSKKSSSKVNIFNKPTTKGGPGSGRKPKEQPQSQSTSHTPISVDSAETRTIQTYSNARTQAIVDFVNKHKLDATALGNFLQKGSLNDRMDFITALVGEPGNKYEKKIIDKFSEKKSETPSSPKRQGKPEVNKKVRQTANDLGITPNDWATSEYKKKMMQAAVEALTDANFHQEARELVAKLEGKPEWVKKPDYGTKEYDKWVKSGVYDSEYYNGDENVRKLGVAASQESGWDGVDAVDSLAYTLRMAGFHKEADTIQSIFDDKSYMKSMNKENMKLVDLIPLKELHFGSQDAFNEYVKQHELRPDTKITIRGKAMTVAQATKNSQPATSTSDSSKNKGGNNSSKKVEDLVKNLSGKKYKEFAFDNDIDPNDANEMQDFINSLSDKDAQDILKKYGTN